MLVKIKVIKSDQDDSNQGIRMTPTNNSNHILLYPSGLITKRRLQLIKNDEIMNPTHSSIHIIPVRLQISTSSNVTEVPVSCKTMMMYSMAVLRSYRLCLSVR
jgi:hypothetical protein